MAEQKRWLQPATGKVVFNDRRDGPAPTGGLWVPVVLIPTMGDVPEFCPSTLTDIYEWLIDSEKYDLSLVELDDESPIDWTGGIGTEVETLTVRGSTKSLESLLDIFDSIPYFLVNRDATDSPTEIHIIYAPNATPITNLDVQRRIDERIAARIADQQKELGEGQPPKESDNDAPDLQEMMEDMMDQAEIQEDLQEQLEKRGQRESIYDQPTELDPDKIDPSMVPGPRTPDRGKGPICFVEGTLIETPDGPYEIEKLTVGDPVYAFDDGELTVVDVETIFTGMAEGYHYITFENGSSFKVTAEHPVYVRINEEWTWVSVQELTLGDEVMLLTIDETLTTTWVNSTAYFEPQTPVEVYNLEVQDPHTYFAEGVLVHNKLPMPGPGPGPPPPPSEETPEDRARRRAMERMREIDEAVQESAETAEDAEQQAETLVSDQPPEAQPTEGDTVPSEEGTPAEEGAPSEEPPPDSNGEPAEDGAPGSPDDDTPGDGQCNPDDPDDPDCKGRFAILDNQSGGFL